MNVIKVSLSAALAASVLSFSPAFAADPSAPREVTVYYNELNMTTQDGATVLYSRLRAASRQVCAPLQSRELKRRAAYTACYDQALTAAVEQVNRTAVTALHMRVTKGVKAS